MVLYSLIYDDTKKPVDGYENVSSVKIGEFLGRKPRSIATSANIQSLVDKKYRIIASGEEYTTPFEMPTAFHIEWNKMMRAFQKKVDWISIDNATSDCLCVVHVGDSSFRAGRMGM